MKLELPTPAYDSAKYGKPYIAQVTFDDPIGTPRWGSFVGLPGEPGLLVLDDVHPGDVILKGQKRKATEYTAPEFFVLMEDKELRDVSKVDAYRHFEARKKAVAEMRASGREDV